VVEAIAADPDDVALTTVPSYSTAELSHLARTEGVVHLADVLMRRTSLAFIGAVTAESAAEVAAAIAPVMGWDAARCVAETDSALVEVYAADPTRSAGASARSSPASVDPIA
jgi:glycerol-3-phosphate dehydrogenase